jgi:uncharacterized protein
MIELTASQRAALLCHARTTIARDLAIDETGGEPDFSHPVFRMKCGAFVTLHKKGALRGCIGYIVGVKEIPDAVAEMARASAFRDPRFPSLTPQEYPQVDIEISILTPLEAVGDVNDIVVGRDGLVITRGRRSGLLLPQVPVEQGWNRDEYLQHLCYKAGLPGDAWKDPDTGLERFSALVFGEDASTPPIDSCALDQ